MDNSKDEPRFQLNRVRGAPVNDDELLSDLQRVARELDIPTVPQKTYREYGTYDDSTVRSHFGSWNDALLKAGLTISNEVEISDDRLFENLLILWQHFGRQPRRSELSLSPSTFSHTPYKRRFGSWTNALKAFVEHANSSGTEIPEQSEEVKNQPKTPRDPSLRLRWQVLQRDRLTCCGCGASPALTPGVELHVDHVHPYSKGGETIEKNLQTLCVTCNLGKSDTTPD